MLVVDCAFGRLSSAVDASVDASGWLGEEKAIAAARKLQQLQARLQRIQPAATALAVALRCSCWPSYQASSSSSHHSLLSLDSPSALAPPAALHMKAHLRGT